MKNTNRKYYSEAFKKETVMCVMRQNSSANSVSKASKDLDINQFILIVQEDAEVKKLRAKVKRFQNERNILKSLQR